MTGFEQASSATLTVIAANLRHGLGVVAERIEAGTFHKVGQKGAAPPAQSGQLTLALLGGVEAELARRTEPPTHQEAHMADTPIVSACTIVTEFLGIMLDPCGKLAAFTSTGRCERGHTRTRLICVHHAEGFRALSNAVVCQQCDRKGYDTQMVVAIAEGVTP